jgi:hypothetical protein
MRSTSKSRHLEQIAERVEAGAARLRGKLRRYRCDVAGYRRMASGFVNLIEHLNYVPGKVPAKLSGLVCFNKNTQYASNRNLLIAL